VYFFENGTGGVYATDISDGTIGYFIDIYQLSLTFRKKTSPEDDALSRLINNTKAATQS
jgi:hypothetical protein